MASYTSGNEGELESCPRARRGTKDENIPAKDDFCLAGTGVACLGTVMSNPRIRSDNEGLNMPPNDDVGAGDDVAMVDRSS